MKVTLRPIDFNALNEFAAMVKWYQDEEIRHLFTVDFNKGPTLPQYPEELRQMKRDNHTNTTYIIEVDGVMVGDASIDTGFEMLMGPKEGTGWLSICIGEKAYRGLGLGYEVMKQLEDFCEDKGLKRLELGVFAYNTRGIHFYEKLGYKRFCTVEKFTWYNGGWHDDLRMEKYL